MNLSGGVDYYEDTDKIDISKLSKGALIVDANKNPVANYDGKNLKVTGDISLTSITGLKAGGSVEYNGKTYTNINGKIFNDGKVYSVNNTTNILSMTNGADYYEVTDSIDIGKLSKGTIVVDAQNNQVATFDGKNLKVTGDISLTSITGLNAGGSVNFKGKTYTRNGNYILLDEKVYSVDDSTNILSMSGGSIFSTIGNDNLINADATLDWDTKARYFVKNGVPVAMIQLSSDGIVVNLFGDGEYTVKGKVSKSYTVNVTKYVMYGINIEIKATKNSSSMYSGSVTVTDSVTLTDVTKISVKGNNAEVYASVRNGKLDEGLNNLHSGCAAFINDKIYWTEGAYNVTDSVTTYADNKTLKVTGGNGVNVTVPEEETISSITGLDAGETVEYDGKTYKYDGEYLTDGTNYYSGGNSDTNLLNLDSLTPVINGNGEVIDLSRLKGGYSYRLETNGVHFANALVQRSILKLGLAPTITITKVSGAPAVRNVSIHVEPFAKVTTDFETKITALGSVTVNGIYYELPNARNINLNIMTTADGKSYLYSGSANVLANTEMTFANGVNFKTDKKMTISASEGKLTEMKDFEGTVTGDFATTAKINGNDLQVTDDTSIEFDAKNKEIKNLSSGANVISAGGAKKIYTDGAGNFRIGSNLPFRIENDDSFYFEMNGNKVSAIGGLSDGAKIISTDMYLNYKFDFKYLTGKFNFGDDEYTVTGDNSFEFYDNYSGKEFKNFSGTLITNDTTFKLNGKRVIFSKVGSDGVSVTSDGNNITAINGVAEGAEVSGDIGDAQIKVANGEYTIGGKKFTITDNLDETVYIQGTTITELDNGASLVVGTAGNYNVNGKTFSNLSAGTTIYGTLDGATTDKPKNEGDLDSDGDSKNIKVNPDEDLVLNLAPEKINQNNPATVTKFEVKPIKISFTQPTDIPKIKLIEKPTLTVTIVNYKKGDFFSSRSTSTGAKIWQNGNGTTETGGTTEVENYDASDGSGIQTTQENTQSLVNAFKNGSYKASDDSFTNSKGGKTKFKVVIGKSFDLATEIENIGVENGMLANLYTQDGKANQMAWTGTSGGNIDASTTRTDVIMQSNFSGENSGGSNLKGGSGTNNFLAGSSDNVYLGTGTNNVYLNDDRSSGGAGIYAYDDVIKPNGGMQISSTGGYSIGDSRGSTYRPTSGGSETISADLADDYAQSADATGEKYYSSVVEGFQFGFEDNSDVLYISGTSSSRAIKQNYIEPLKEMFASLVEEINEQEDLTEDSADLAESAMLINRNIRPSLNVQNVLRPSIRNVDLLSQAAIGVNTSALSAQIQALQSRLSSLKLTPLSIDTSTSKAVTSTTGSTPVDFNDNGGNVAQIQDNSTKNNSTTSTTPSTTDNNSTNSTTTLDYIEWTRKYEADFDKNFDSEEYFADFYQFMKQRYNSGAMMWGFDSAYFAWEVIGIQVKIGVSLRNSFRLKV